MSTISKVGKCGCLSPNIWAVFGDDGTQIITISIPRSEGNVDLNGLSWRVNIRNADGKTDVYIPLAENIRTNNDTIEFDWPLGGVATGAVGTTKYSVEGVKPENSTVVIWRSAPGAIYVKENVMVELSEDDSNALSELERLIVYVQQELPGVLLAGNDANEAAEKANQAAIAANEAAERANEAAENAGSGGSGGSGGSVGIASSENLGVIRVGENLKIDKNGVLSVDTATAVEQDNTRPVTSAAVHTELGNIEALLANI